MSRIRFLILPQCRRTLTAVNFRPVRTSVVAVCCVVILAVPSGRAQEEQNPKNSVLQRTSPAIILRFRPGAWGVAGVELVNHRDQPTEVVTGLYFDEAPMTQFSRRAWLPGNSRRLTWIPALPPDDGRKELRARHFLYSNADDSRTLVRAANELLFEAETLALREPPITVIVDDWYVDDEASLAESKELAITMRLAARYTRVVIEVDADSVPAFHEGLNAVDHIVLAGDQIADSPTGLASIRTWLQNGGRLWVLLDQVKMSTVELLLGDAVEITEVDRVRLTEIQFRNTLKDELCGSLRTYEDPIELVRVIAPDAEITHEVNGWPAAFRQNISHGRVLFTTLGAKAWWRPRLVEEQVHELDRNGSFIAIQALEEVADYLTRPLDPPPLTPADFEPFLSGDIGYRIPGRGTVLTFLGAFWIGLLGMGFWLLRIARLERLALVGPILACLAAVPLVVLGERARNAIPPKAAIAEVVHVGPGTHSIHSTGVVAMFVPEPTDVHISAHHSRLLTPRRERLEGEVRQMMWTDLDDWQWEDLTLPTGLHFATTHQHTSTATALRATATFGPSGVSGKLASGPYAKAADALIATKTQHAIAIHLQPDGSFSAGQSDLRAPGFYLTDTFLTDEQRRRQRVYQAMLRPRLDFSYPNRPMLLAWTRPAEASLTFPEEMQQSRSALLCVPLEIQSPPPGTDVFVPSPFLTFETIATADGTKSTAHDVRTGQWQKTSFPTVTMLRFLVPKPLLPLELTRGTLFFRIRAPLRTVSLASGAATELMEVGSLENPVGSYEFPIQHPDGLQLDNDGALHVQLNVSDLQLQETEDIKLKEIDRSWKMDYIRLELFGRTEHDKAE
ncbi:MAG: hypothetical protein ABGZ23_01315 [Fuerstiella sp.]